MRHRLANKSLSRPTAHRVLMLRNLVSSLLAHERISTTLAKAKEAQKMAERVIGWGKRGGKDNWDRANSFLLNPSTTLRPLFSTYATRYAAREGGYTRIHRAGHRKGDHAPVAILELVDSLHDIKFDTAARAVGRELAVRAKGNPGVWWEFRKSVEGGSEADVVGRLEDAGELEELTRRNVAKALRFRQPSLSSSASDTFSEESAPDADSDPSLSILSPSTTFLNLAHEHYLRTLATLSLSTSPTPDPDRTIKQLSQRLVPSAERGPPRAVNTVPMAGRRAKAGDRTDGWESEAETESRDALKIGGPISRAKGARGRAGRAPLRVPKSQADEASP